MRLLVILFITILSLQGGKAQKSCSFKTSDGEWLYFTSIGSGESVVLLSGGPGFGANSLKHWTDSLKHHFKCILFDQRGTGLSVLKQPNSTKLTIQRAVDDIEELRKELKIKTLTLLGFSWGSYLAMCYASQYPENTEKIIMVCPFIPTINKKLFKNNLESRMLPIDKDSLVYWKNQPKSKQSQAKCTYFKSLPYFYNRDIAKKVLPDFLAGISFNTTTFKLMKNSQVPVDTLRKYLKNYDGSCELIRPKNDPIPESIVNQIQTLIPQSHVHYILNCGHFPAFEKVEVFYPKLITSLKN